MALEIEEMTSKRQSINITQKKVDQTRSPKTVLFDHVRKLCHVREMNFHVWVFCMTLKNSMSVKYEESLAGTCIFRRNEDKRYGLGASDDIA